MRPTSVSEPAHVTAWMRMLIQLPQHHPAKMPRAIRSLDGSRIRPESFEHNHKAKRGSVRFRTFMLTESC
jgi:hypothetical protein